MSYIILVRAENSYAYSGWQETILSNRAKLKRRTMKEHRKYNQLLFFGWYDNASHNDSLAEDENQEGWDSPDHQRGINNCLVGLALQLEYPDHKCPHVPVGNDYQGHHELAVGPRKSRQGNHGQDWLGQIHGK